MDDFDEETARLAVAIRERAFGLDDSSIRWLQMAINAVNAMPDTLAQRYEERLRDIGLELFGDLNMADIAVPHIDALLSIFGAVLGRESKADQADSDSNALG